MKLALGLMSGTSGDGLSIALAGFSQKNCQVLAYKTFPYPSEFSKKLARAAEMKTPELSLLNAELGIFFAKRTQEFLKTESVKISKIEIIGSHGHTVFHSSDSKTAHTLQIGEPSYLAEALNVPVVSDFRPRDIAAGGSGAPLIPFFDQFFWGDKVRALQNIGGIANVTVVGTPKLSAFDTGPGNCLIDWAVQRMTNGKQSYDKSGKIASRGKINLPAVKKMISHAYFQKRPPKSTGRELFNENWIPAPLRKSKPEDLIATLTYFTAYSIYMGYQKWIKDPIREVIVSGGGAYNLTLMTHLIKLFAPIPVVSIEHYKIDVQSKEPAAFAFFALQAIEGKINHSPEGTGAKRAVVLGKITPVFHPHSSIVVKSTVGSEAISKQNRFSKNVNAVHDDKSKQKNLDLFSHLQFTSAGKTSKK